MTDTASAHTATTGTAPGTPPLGECHHVALTVSDIDRSEAWYREVLGFERAFVDSHVGGDGSGYAVVLLRPDTVFHVGLEHHDAHPDEPFDERRTGLDHVAFAVAQRADIDRWREHLDRLGVRHGEINEGSLGSMRYATLSFWDPDGIALELCWLA
jgi:glyoxylase I family protein